MPIYDFTCSCGRKQEVNLTIKNRNKTVKCKCGNYMQRKVSCPRAIIMGKTTGFMSNGKFIKKDSNLRNRVRSTYFGDDSDTSVFVP